MTKDLTEGSPFKLICTFSIPILLGNLFQQFYNLVDTIIVGRTIGAEALGAVGSTGCMMFMVLGFTGGLCAGFTIPIAQRFGDKDYKGMKVLTGNTVHLSILFSIVLTALTVSLCSTILKAMQTPIEIIGRSNTYLRIVFWGIPFFILYDITSGIMRALGDSKTPFLFLVIGSVLNIFLDLLFIVVFKMDVAGAALATIVSQALSGFASLIYMIKKFKILKLSKDDLKVDLKSWKELCGAGLPMGLQYSITAIGSVILQSAINSLGYITVTAVTAAMKIHMFACTVYDALGTTMATYVGQNRGAWKLDRIKKGVHVAMFISIGCCVVFFLVMFFFGKQLTSIFLKNPSDDILTTARTYLIGNSAFYIALAAVDIYRFAIQGMGFSKFAMFSGLFEMVARSVMGIFIVPLLGFWGVALASPCAWVLADLFLIPAFLGCMKKLKAQRVAQE